MVLSLVMFCCFGNVRFVGFDADPKEEKVGEFFASYYSQLAKNSCFAMELCNVGRI